MSKKGHKWIVPEDIPSPFRFRRKEEYDECVDEFLKSGFRSVRVNIPNVRPRSLYRQLNKTLKKKGLSENIKVCIREEKVFLVRTE